MGRLVRHVALVSELNPSVISISQLTQVSAALSKQVARDFGPIWEVDATVDAFNSLDDVPLGYWPVIIRDDIGEPGAAGVHKDNNGQPLALVQFDQNWSLTASHECLEMLADPFGSRVVAGPSPKSDQGRVSFLVEVCDPSEDISFAYTVNDIVVSDFYTPNYFDPEPAQGVRYSFTGAIQSPRQVLRGGYLSWHDPVSDHWWQEVFFGARAEFRDLGGLGRLEGSIRSVIDRLTPEPFQRLAQLARSTAAVAGSRLTAAGASAAAQMEVVGRASVAASQCRAEGWRQLIGSLIRARGEAPRPAGKAMMRKGPGGGGGKKNKGKAKVKDAGGGAQSQE